MEQREVIVPPIGWCTNCTCRPHFHIGTPEACDSCKCTNFKLDTYRDSLDKYNREVIMQNTSAISWNKGNGGYNSDDDSEEYNDDAIQLCLDFDLTESTETDKNIEVFFGEVSRSCGSCGQTKLYKDFNDSRDPNDICNYCLWEQSEEEMLDETLSDAEYMELQETENEIIENELTWYEAQERQNLIDEVLRELDE